MARKPKSIAEMSPDQRRKYIRQRAQALIKENWSEDDLKEFRHQLAILKRRGVPVSNVAVRRALPTRNTKALVKNFQDVIHGEARVWKAPADIVEGWKDDVQKVIRTYKNKLIVPKTHYVTKIKTPSGGRTTTVRSVAQRGKNFRIVADMMPAPLSSYEQFRDWILEKYGDKKIPANKRWAFRYYGNNSIATFNSLYDLLSEWERYGEKYGDTKRFEDNILKSIQNLEILTIQAGTRWHEENLRRRERERRRRRKEYKITNPLAVEAKRARDRAYRKRTYDTKKNTRKRRKQRAKETGK